MDLSPFYRPRHPDSRKGEYGRIVVAGGSERYAGAPAFNALAALRTGADMAFVVAPRRAADLVAGYSPDLITIPCGTSFPDPDVVLELLKDADALVLGGGVERTPAAHEALRTILGGARKPVVVDAEAIRALKGFEALVRGKPVLLTPHGGEYEHLAGAPWPADEPARKEMARGLAARLRCAVIVKGRWDVVSDGTRVHVDPAGSDYLTKGGYGDLLAGAAGALLARGASPYDAACAAAWIVGSAGEKAAARLGESTLASDALGEIAGVLPRHER